MTNDSSSRFRPISALAAAVILFPVLLGIIMHFLPANEDASGAARLNTIVVVPARVTGANETSYLSHAVAGTLSAYLQRVPGLDTKQPPTGFPLEGSEAGYKEIARSYQADGLVLIALTIDGGLYMLNVQLADPINETVFWSNRFLGPRDKYLAIIQEAGEGLRRVLRPSSSRIDFRAAVSSVVEAELNFREGEYYRDRKESKNAMDAFNRALIADPALAAAAAEIARLYASAEYRSVADVDAWAARAIDLDPRCGRAYTALAEIEPWRDSPDPRRRLQNALRGAALDPSYPLAHKILGEALTGLPQQSMLAISEWRRLAPLASGDSETHHAALQIDQIGAMEVIEEARKEGMLPRYL